MRGFVLIFSLAIQHPAPPADAWLGEDKLKHFFMSAFIQSMGYSSLRAAGVAHPLALAGASATTATFGIGKEVWDAHGHGTPSGKDLAWDAAGAGAATLLLVRSPR
jgi:putative lipoprotein